jgi:competence protein ComEC
VTIRNQADALSVGDPISVLASLSPPGGPVMPGGYDFAFVPFYERIGAVGFAFGAAKPADIGPAPLAIRLAEPLAHLRDAIRIRIEEALPGDYGHIAAALIMGDQRGIAEGTQDAMRASGLGHILSISGLHLALVAGSVFWLIRALLALSPTLALNYPIKKWAAAAALAVATFYLGISGAEVATVRSYVMLAIMLGAILIDRRALTLRNVALAALLILIFSPESLLSISFQMSFAATVALIATYEAIAARADRSLADMADRTVFGRIREQVGTLFLTSLVAGLATAPFGAFYFQRVAPLTIVANMAVAPAIGFVVMPMVLLAVVAMPFGLELFPLTAMKWGLAWMVAVAEKTAAWSAGFGGIAMPPPGALLLMVGGFLWLALWRERWRFAGLVPIVVALPLAFLGPRPDILIDEAGAVAAVRGDDGRFSIIDAKGNTFEVENWLRADADLRKADAVDLNRGVACDALGCIANARGGQEVAFIKRPDAFAEDCRSAAVIISRLDAPPGCAARALVIDRDQLARFGAHALYVNGGGFRIETAYPEVRRPFMPPVRE